MRVDKEEWEVAKTLHKSTETIRRWIWDGKLPATKIGGHLFIARESLSLYSAGAGKSDTASSREDLIRRARLLRASIRRRIGKDFDINEILEASRSRYRYP